MQNHLEGQKFGRLIVIKKIGKSKFHRILWLCKCKCGKEKIVNLHKRIKYGFTIEEILKTEHKKKNSKLFFTYNNITLSLTEWAKKLNIPYSALYHKISKGHTIKTILETE